MNQLIKSITFSAPSLRARPKARPSLLLIKSSSSVCFLHQAALTHVQDTVIPKLIWIKQRLTSNLEGTLHHFLVKNCCIRFKGADSYLDHFILGCELLQFLKMPTKYVICIKKMCSPEVSKAETLLSMIANLTFVHGRHKWDCWAHQHTIIWRFHNYLDNLFQDSDKLILPWALRLLNST